MVKRGQKVQEAEAVKVKEGESVVFEHDNQYLFVPAVDVQFRNGKFETADAKVIEFLSTQVTGVRVAK